MIIILFFRQSCVMGGFFQRSVHHCNIHNIRIYISSSFPVCVVDSTSFCDGDLLPEPMSLSLSINNWQLIDDTWLYDWTVCTYINSLHGVLTKRPSDVCLFVYLHPYQCWQVFDLLTGDTGRELVDKLQRNTRLFRERMTDAGFTLKVLSRTIQQYIYKGTSLLCAGHDVAY